jgi:5,6-dimethylbenzimidazole synthase
MTPIDDFVNLARKRRSIRMFKPDPVSDEAIEKILEAARWAMSGANAQPWEFIVIKDGETKKKLGEAYLWITDASLKVELTRLPEYSHTKFSRSNVNDLSGYILWTRAPVMIAVLGDARTLQASNMTGRYFEEHTFTNNLANATHMIHLAAAALGLGAQWVTIMQPVSEMMKPILGIPEALKLFSLVPIGYAAQQVTPYRRELSEMVHYEKYDLSKFRSQDEIQEFIKHLRRRHAGASSYPRSGDKPE